MVRLNWARYAHGRSVYERSHVRCHKTNVGRLAVQSGVWGKINKTDFKLLRAHCPHKCARWSTNYHQGAEMRCAVLTPHQQTNEKKRPSALMRLILERIICGRVCSTTHQMQLLVDCWRKFHARTAQRVNVFGFTICLADGGSHIKLSASRTFAVFMCCK